MVHGLRGLKGSLFVLSFPVGMGRIFPLTNMVNKQIIVEDFDDIKIPVVITWTPWSVGLNVLISPKIVRSTTNGCSLVHIVGLLYPYY